MTKIHALLMALTSLFLASCAVPYGISSVPTSDHPAPAPPVHKGTPLKGTFDQYSYAAYTDGSVNMAALSPISADSEIRAYDINRDGSLDTVFVKVYGKWKYRTNLGGRVIPPSLDPRTFSYYLQACEANRQMAERKRQEARNYERLKAKVRREIEAESTQEYDAWQ